jgi:cytochrome c heme-lyase
MSGCPVDHTSSSQDNKSSSSWSRFFSYKSPSSSPALSTERETSSIPKASDANWVYPSEAQFFAAMARKNHNPQAADMKTIVPIHNAVNERAWAEIMKWETGRGSEACGGVRLVNFKGRPNEPSLRARWKVLLGCVASHFLSFVNNLWLPSYSPPFDRHDWVVDRCGIRTRYIIDFYTGHSASSNLSFYLDVRPALDNWEGVKMRAESFWSKTVQTLISNSESSTNPK